ncbi:Membrane fusion component of tripartite multidrug resistance system [Moritella sp. JT01]|uniref:HlyD family secretion protein n=1 Tax=Moritella sp. JT01 TaxID=756698 RepID=UPI0007928EBE|nr:HlyD family secretion protein [Moritella sp. JT01]KXO13843.1 Membrane fusion component of tripartite multidrug resistance system [Moritella sp. JT01]
MKDTIYKYAIYSVLTVTIGFSAFLISADNIAPFTTQATIHKTIANIAPEVSGVITAVNVINGQSVKVGDVLFSVDKKSYALAVQQAKAELHKIQESNSAKWQELQSANQILSQRTIEWKNTDTKYRRYQQLLNKGLITQQDVDDSLTNVNIAQSAVEAANADILRIKVDLPSDNKNAAIEIVEAKLLTAQLDLQRTDIIATTAGTVSNLQLQQGTYINKGSASLFLVNEANSWLSADFNEKGVAHLTTNTAVWIAFDALPGTVFEGKISNQDRAIFDPSTSTNQLSTVVNDTRWIREQQKIRTRISVDDIDSVLIAGSRASVMVKNGNQTVDFIGYAWIKLVACFRYIY